MKATIYNYLQTTSIHGCFYLYDGQNWIEKSFWFLLLVMSLTISGLLIQQSLFEANQDPILTTLTTTNIREIPFPAITINADSEINPWGFMEKILNQLAFYSHDNRKWKNKVFQTSSILRTRFEFIFHNIVQRMRQKLKEKLRDSINSIVHWKTYFDKLENLGGPVKVVSRNQKKLDPIVKKLSVIYIKDIMQYKKVLKSLDKHFSSAFFQFHSYELSKFMKPMQSIIQDTINDVSSFEVQNITNCLEENGTICFKHFLSVYGDIMAYFEINKFPYGFMGFGTFLTYFSRFISTQKEEIPFLSSTQEDSIDEKFVEEFMANIFDNLSSIQCNISIFELVQYLDFTKHQNYFKFNQLRKDNNCKMNDYLDNAVENCEMNLECCNMIDEIQSRIKKCFDVESMMKVFRYE